MVIMLNQKYVFHYNDIAKHHQKRIKVLMFPKYSYQLQLNILMQLEVLL